MRERNTERPRSGRYDDEFGERRHAGYGDDEGRVQQGRDHDRDEDFGRGGYSQSGFSAQRDRDRPDRGGAGQGYYGQSGYGEGRYWRGATGTENYGNFGQGDYGGERGEGQGYGYGYDQSGTRWGSRGSASYQGSAGEDRQYAGRRGQYSARYGQSGGQGFAGPGYGDTGYGDADWGARGQGQGLHRGKGPKGYQRSDERIKEMLCERLCDDPQIDPSDVTVSVSGGRITLDGSVDSRQSKNAIEDIAEQLAADVQNNLRVARQNDSARQGSGVSSSVGGSSGRTGGFGSSTETSAAEKNKRN